MTASHTPVLPGGITLAELDAAIEAAPRPKTTLIPAAMFDPALAFGDEFELLEELDALEDAEIVKRLQDEPNSSGLALAVALVLESRLIAAQDEVNELAAMLGIKQLCPAAHMARWKALH